mgnify:CR=1 FL=1
MRGRGSVRERGVKAEARTSGFTLIAVATLRAAPKNPVPEAICTR